MADYLFVSQAMLDNWMQQDKIDFVGSTMTIRGDQKSYGLEAAVRFVKVVGSEADPHDLIGKVKTLEQIEGIGGEHYHDSVLVGEIAYEVQNGFVARVKLGQHHTPPPRSVAKGVGEPIRATPPPQPAAAPPAAPRPAPAAPPAPAPRAATPLEQAAASSADEPHAEDSDEELLTKFLLDNLR